jgi:alcohol dehydrogenase YqhD (iron-dependent ADH family)
VHLKNPNPFKRSYSMPKTDNDSSNSIQRTRSWYERLGLKKAGSFTDDDIKSSDCSLVRFAPITMKNSMK